MLSAEDGEKAVQFARDIIETHIKNTNLSSYPLSGLFDQERGVFVTLHTYPTHDLRGCIGIPQPVMPLRNALVESAKSATCDPRFPPLREQELGAIIVEVTILTKPELIEVSKPDEYPTKIIIGRDGLIVEQGVYKGLLLPQVPVEQCWNEEEFLCHTCMKAGLPPDAWFDKNTRVSKFQGQIFSEVAPCGEIKEKTFHGSNNRRTNFCE